MLLRFQHVGRFGIVGGFALLVGTSSCSKVDDVNTSSTGGAGSPSGGMTTAGTATATSGSATGGTSAGTTSSGASAGGSATAGTTTGGTTTGGAGAGSGGTSGGTGGGTGGTGGASSGTGGGGGSGGSGGPKSKTTFFVTSDTSMTGKLGGLTGADKRCQDLAVAAGFGDHTFHAYLSTATVNAKDRIGTGPWTNSKGAVVAASVAALHDSTVKGDHTIFIDEKGMPIHGQWDSSATVEHDILTGSKADGTVQTGVTCMDWTSDSAADKAQVGHCDGEGPGMATTGTYTSWNSAHANGGCNDTKPLGGAGRLYCFAID